MNKFNLWIFGILLSTSCFIGAEEIDFDKAAGSNLGRLEEDDGDPETEVNSQPDRLGAMELSVNFKQAGEATMALYSEEGQLIRILGQLIPVEAGEFRLRWDGLDLFGNLVPAGTTLELKTFFNPGIRVSYEMSVVPPKVAPWPGTFETPEGVREGGWLGDHSTPHGATAIGEMVFLGFKLAEEGDNLIAVNAEGEKVWGHKLDGWGGPSLLNSNGKDLAAMDAKGRRVFRVNPDPVPDKKGRLRIQQDQVLSAPGLEHLTVHENDLLVIGRNNAVPDQIPHPRAFSNRNIDFIRSIPQVLNNTPPSDFHISPQAAFGNIFTAGGSPQVGRNMIPHEGYAFFLLVLKNPAAVGTVVLPELKGVGRLEVLTLKEGTAYDESMAPNAGGGGDDLMSLTLNAQGAEWQPFAKSSLSRPLNWMTGDDGAVTTQAILIKAFPEGNSKADWKPSVPMARVLALPTLPASSSAPDLSTPTRTTQWKADFGSPTGWRARTEFPISETYPLEVIQTYPQDITFNTVVALSALNPSLRVDVLRSGVEPTSATADDWIEVGSFSPSSSKKLGPKTSSRHFYDRYVQFRDSVTTRAIRYSTKQGYQGGKWGESKDDAGFSEVQHLEPLMAKRGSNDSVEAPSHILYWVDFETGETQESWTENIYDIGTFDFAPDGTLYTVANGRLNQTEWDRETGEFTHKPLGKASFDSDHTLFMDVDTNRIAVSNSNDHVVQLFDRNGKLRETLGSGSFRKPGVWNRNVLVQPRGVALSTTGDIWVAENSFAPKRITQFSSDGSFKAEHLGPPMYGGGGHLDPDMKHFFYRGMEYHIDLEKGTSHLARLYDRPYAENTPDAKAFTFGGIRYSRPIHFKGRRYLVGGNTIITRKPNDADHAIPAVVMGEAMDHPFLKHEIWKDHWAKQNLQNSIFVWCDLNGDGAYQVNEVELGDSTQLPKGIGNGTIAPDLALWGKNYRWSPRSFTSDGVPVFRLADVVAFDYDALAEHYPRNYTLSGPTSAKPTYGGFRYVSAEGYLVQEGQPFVVKPEGTLLGGSAPKRSDYMPPIPGKVVQTAWSWAGGGVTQSDVGEIAVINSYKGAWHVWAVKYGVMVGRFFTGEEGTFNGLKPLRGMNVTRRYMGWEGWHADFVQANSGNFYAQGGKSFHSVNEVHGLDDLQVFNQTFTVPEAAYQINRTNRPVLVGRHQANAGHELNAYASKIRLDRTSRLDGLIEDWGDRGQFTFMDEEKRSTRFDVSFDQRGLLIAIDGRGNISGDLKDWRKALSDGFAIDLNVRRGGRHGQNSVDVLPGDKRILIAKVNGEWTGVLFEPLVVNPADKAPNPFTVTSPYLDLTFQNARTLTEKEIEIHLRETSLEINLNDIGDGMDLGMDMGMGGGFMLDSEKESGETKLGSGDNWTAEILLPWTLIGSGEGMRRFDIGIREAGEGSHFFWNNRYPGPQNDPDLQAVMNPRAWGRLILNRKR